jgi:hypothetical protein
MCQFESDQRYQNDQLKLNHKLNQWQSTKRAHNNLGKMQGIDRKLIKVEKINDTSFNSCGEFSISPNETLLSLTYSHLQSSEKIFCSILSTEILSVYGKIYGECSKKYHIKIKVKLKEHLSIGDTFMDLPNYKGAEGFIWHRSVFVVEEILLAENDVFRNKVSVAKFYVKDLEKFIGITKDIKKFHDSPNTTNLKPIEIGDIGNGNILAFCFDSNFGKDKSGGYICTYKTEVTPYVQITFKQDIEIEEAQGLIYDFTFLYSLLTGKKTAFNRVELNNGNLRRHLLYSSVNSKMFKINYINEFLHPNSYYVDATFSKIANIFSLNDFKENNFELFRAIFTNKKLKEIQGYNLFGRIFYEGEMYQRLTELWTCVEVFLDKSKNNEDKLIDLANYLENILKDRSIKEEIEAQSEIGKIFEPVSDVLSSLNSGIKNFNITLDRKNYIKRNLGLETFLKYINPEIINKNYLEKIRGNRNNIVHGRISKVKELKTCTEILELIFYYLLFDNIFDKTINREIIQEKLLNYSRNRNFLTDIH